MEQEEWHGEYDPLDDPEERKHLLSVLESFRSYRRLAHFNSTHVRRQAFYSLPSEHWTLLAQPPFSVLDSLSELDDLVDLNSVLAEAIFIVGFEAFISPGLDSEWVASIVDEKSAQDEFQLYSAILDHWKAETTQNNLDKARSCINQFYRDWSAEGAVERRASFEPVLDALEHEFRAIRSVHGASIDKGTFKVLVPGAGLGRLVFDTCHSGFAVEGNEISYHELMASNWVLNRTRRPFEVKIAPFALNSSNHLNRRDQFRTFNIPDVHPSTELASTNEETKIPPSERMSMTAGDFIELYSSESNRAAFNAVATVFFIDTAPNVIRYIETVRDCLVTGGIWINLGPLLWHHASRFNQSCDDRQDSPTGNKTSSTGIGEPGSVELTDEEVVKLVEYFGFTIEKHETDKLETGYISDSESMLRNTYHPSFWIARKK